MSDTTISPAETEEEYTERMRRADAAMEAAGVATTEQAQVDYFGFDLTERVMLPDGKSWVEIQALNEGGRRQYLNSVNRELRIAKNTGDSYMRMANGDERLVLLRLAICDWNLVRKNQKTGVLEPVNFTSQKLEEFLKNASPKVTDLIDKAVRKLNDWMLQDVTLDDLLKQRDELDEMIERKRADDEGKES